MVMLVTQMDSAESKPQTHRWPKPAIAMLERRNLWSPGQPIPYSRAAIGSRTQWIKISNGMMPDHIIQYSEGDIVFVWNDNPFEETGPNKFSFVDSTIHLEWSYTKNGLHALSRNSITYKIDYNLCTFEEYRRHHLFTHLEDVPEPPPDKSEEIIRWLYEAPMLSSRSNR